MGWRCLPRRFNCKLSTLGRALLIFLLLSLGLPAVAPSPRAAERPNGAGLVIRYGDGQVAMYYVEFREPELSGLELLLRSGSTVTLANFGSLGFAVCAIDGEGCPADDCFCQSYGSPPFYWHYYRLREDGSWVLQSVGPSSRRVRDGDVDGWAWTSGEIDLPHISIETLAGRFGVQRLAPPGSQEPGATLTRPEPLAPLASAPAEPIASPEVPPVRLVPGEPTPVDDQAAGRLDAVMDNVPGEQTPVDDPATPPSAQPSAQPVGSGLTSEGTAFVPPFKPPSDVSTPEQAPPAPGEAVAAASSDPPHLGGYLVFALMCTIMLVLVAWLARQSSPGT